MHCRQEGDASLEGESWCNGQPGFVSYFGLAAAVDADECASGTHNCPATAECNNTHSSFTCTCVLGWRDVGGYVCGDEDECAAQTHDCDSAHGVCVNTPGSFECVCAKDTYGDGLTCTACGSKAVAPQGSIVADNCTCPNGYEKQGTDCEDIGGSCSVQYVARVCCMFACGFGKGYEVEMDRFLAVACWMRDYVCVICMLVACSET